MSHTIKAGVTKIQCPQVFNRTDTAIYFRCIKVASDWKKKLYDLKIQCFSNSQNIFCWKNRLHNRFTKTACLDALKFIF